jgi:hypothetical protein
MFTFVEGEAVREKVQTLLKKSILDNYLLSFSEGKGTHKVRAVVESPFSCVLEGLRLLLKLEGRDLVKNVQENTFNIEAKPFQPTSQTLTQDPFAPFLPKTKASTAEKENRDSKVEKKREIADMFQYYNFLLFNQNKDSFNQIDPAWLKLTKQYDQEVDKSYMNVQSHPQIIKAALGQTEAPRKTIRYSKDEILAIFQTMGNFRSPLTQTERFSIPS